MDADLDLSMLPIFYFKLNAVIGELMWINLTAMIDGFSLEAPLVILNLLKYNETIVQFNNSGITTWAIRYFLSNNTKKLFDSLFAL